MLCNQPVSPLKNTNFKMSRGEATDPKDVRFRVKNVSKIVGTENEKQQGRIFRVFFASKVCGEHLINICSKALQIRYACENFVHIKIQFTDHLRSCPFSFFYQCGCFILLKIDCDIYICLKIETCSTNTFVRLGMLHASITL
jgi:hypothetical protein